MKFEKKLNQIKQILEKLEITEEYECSSDAIQSYISYEDIEKVAIEICKKFGVNPPTKK